MAVQKNTKIEIRPKSRIAKQYHKEVYLKKINKILDEISQIPLSILVWGPGPSNIELYNKRIEILNKLREMGLDANFSEEISKQMNNIFSEKGKEFIQAMAADLVIILRCSYGSLAELHDFADYKSIAGKLYIFIDEESMDSYSSLGAVSDLDKLYRKIEKFRFPDDVSKCNLLGRIIDFVIKIQYTKYMAQKNAVDLGIVY